MSIYKIYNDTKCYIGKTKVKYVSRRISKHRYLFKHNAKYQCSCKIIFQEGDWDWKILETNIDPNKLSEREQYYINNTDNCINISNVMLNDEERKERRRQQSSITYYKNRGTTKDPNNNRREYKANWRLKKKWGEDWVYHTRNPIYKKTIT